ncbi:MAG: hypothetical protein ACLFT1_02520, partial [Desulfonatronovibrio sp.]
MGWFFQVGPEFVKAGSGVWIKPAKIIFTDLKAFRRGGPGPNLRVTEEIAALAPVEWLRLHCVYS